MISGTKIDSTRAKYPTSIDGIHQAQLVDATPEEKPPLIWIDGILRMEEAESLLPNQRVNKIPCMDYLCFKTTFFKEMNSMRYKFPQLYNFYPPTFILPEQYAEFQHEHSIICSRRQTSPTWVVKPKNSCCGKGIKLIQSVYEAQYIENLSVAQLLVDPFLIHGLKFDFRFFLLISSLKPFSAFIYHEGIARFCTETYTPPSKSNRNHQFCYLTNTAINVNSKKAPEEFTKPATEVLKEMIHINSSTHDLWNEIKTMCRYLLSGLYPAMMTVLPHQSSSPMIHYHGDNSADESKYHGKLPPIKSPKVQSRYLKANITNRKQSSLSDLASEKSEDKSEHVAGQTEEAQEKSLEETQDKIQGSDEILEQIPEEIKQEKCEKIEKSKSAFLENPKKKNSDDLKEPKKYFQIVGVDIIIDSNGHPQLLELNDRPSLSVTVPFEKDLKTGMIRDMFYHITLDGSTIGENPESGWQQIIPSKDTQEEAQLKQIMEMPSHIKYTGRLAAQSPTTTRMIENGIKLELHKQRRERFESLRQSGKQKRFNNVLKSTF